MSCSSARACPHTLSILGDSQQSDGRQELKRVGVSGSHDREMPVIERSHPPLAKPLEQRDDARVHDAQPQVGIAALQRVTAFKIGLCRGFDAVGTEDDVLEERQPYLAVEPFVAPVVKLRQYERERGT